MHGRQSRTRRLPPSRSARYNTPERAPVTSISTPAATGRAHARRSRVKNGTFVLDAHTGFWDASPQNTKNRFGDAFIETFYAFHKGFNPPDPKWTMPYDTVFRKVD